MKKIELRENKTKRVMTINEDPSLTDQQWQKSCDVNTIIAKYKKTGEIKHLAAHQGQYADLSELPDLLTALNTVNTASSTFEQLPAQIRKYFANDPVELYTFLQDPKNDQEAIRLGLKTASRIVTNPEETVQATEPQPTTQKTNS